ncbi:MAG: RcnB family protein [Pseudomonadota bacterium]|nr:RcnB family protein [Pseudomonadota bacterium]
MHASDPTRREHRRFHREVNRDHNRYHREWDRGWRNDRRYDWQNYRFSNRGLYSPGYYYSPYRNHSYSRFGIGVTLGSGFYSSRYWINDPWRYRLPEPFPGTRWIRYYNDVLLVDTFTGEVVDVIYDFFW